MNSERIVVISDDLTPIYLAQVGAHTAAIAIRNTPSGGISATNVQDALNELDADKEPAIAPGTTSQYWRGDKTWQELDKAAVGLGNVDNTSDADKPISAATQAALEGKENAIPAGTTSDYWRGDKSWRDFFTDVRNAVLTGLSTATNAAITATDTVLQAFGKLQAQVSSKQDALVSGTNIKTVNGQSLLGAGNLTVGGGSGTPISVVGPTSAYVTTTVTFTITDFDDFDAYTVTASHGTVSRSGATITYTAPGTVPDGGADAITIQRGTGQRVLTIQILPASVMQPTVTVTGAPSDVPESPLIGTSAFQTAGVTDTHASTTWRVRKVADNSVVWESVNNSTNLTQIVVPSGILQEGTQYRFEAIHNGATLGASAVGFIQATTKQQFAIIIGLVQAATGGGAGTYVRVDANFAPKATDATFFNNHPTYSGIVTQTIDGQQMVKIPKFYFKAGTVPSGTYAGKAYWMISDQPAAGFSVHPAFLGAGGAELDQIWVGKYQASSSSGKLQSVPGVLPRVDMNFPTARAEAYARNVSGVSGFRLWSYYDLAAIQMLATIEMGGLNMQSLIGQGRVSASSAANVNASDVAKATWRDIVGLWGNVFQMVDGLKRNGGNWWRWEFNVPGNTTTSDFATGYINTGRPALTSEGYPVTFDTTLLSSGIIVPATVNGTASNGSTGDYFWSITNTDDRIVYHGGSWSEGAGAGLFCLNVNAAPSLAYTSFGCRLAKV